MTVLQVLRRLLGLPSGGWPSRTPPTASMDAPTFYCAGCKHPVEASDQTCPACGLPTSG